MIRYPFGYSEVMIDVARVDEHFPTADRSGFLTIQSRCSCIDIINPFDQYLTFK